MAAYKECKYCGAHLDPAEKCDCIEKKKEGAAGEIYRTGSTSGQGQKQNDKE